MDKPLILCGKVFTAELICHLNERLQADPALSNNALARIVCEHLAWWSSAGQAAVASAKKAIAKLKRLGLLCWPGAKAQAKRSHRLRPSGQALPQIQRLPSRVEEIVGLRLHLLSGHEDPLKKGGTRSSQPNPDCHDERREDRSQMPAPKWELGNAGEN